MVCLKLITSGLIENFHLIVLYPPASVYLVLGSIRMFGLNTIESLLVQFNCSVVSHSLWPHELQHSGLPVHHQLPEFTQTHVHGVGDAIQPSHLLSSLLLLPPIPPSIRVFSNESTLRMRWPKYWSFSFSISPPNEHPRLISFRMDWLDLLAV